MHASSLEGVAFALISIPLLMVFSQYLTTVLSVIQIVPQCSPTFPTRFSVAMSRTSELISTIPSSALHSTLVPRSTLIICYLTLSDIVIHMKRTLLICAKLSSFLAASLCVEGSYLHHIVLDTRYQQHTTCEPDFFESG
ncbi:hypothetical protein EDB19DRAFT_1339536 [Suillus lakei]|nr:hypothetical protein EDB19DRAFT_1339536 [Suillus lakei]